MPQTNATGPWEVKIDGTTEISWTGSNNAAAVFPSLGAADTVADTYTVYYDDYAIDNAGWVGDSSIVCLFPISDNARATLWTGGAGGTTNLYNAIDNVPPAGTATETDLTQIEHAGGAGGTTDAYDANMTDFTTAGVGSGDTVKTVYPFMVTGEDAASGNKLLNLQILSNPTNTVSSNNNVAPTSGALGTFPTGWFTMAGYILENPTVTKGTSPILRIVRPETASGVASVCFAGIYVEFGAASASIIPQAQGYYRQLRG